MVSPGHLDYTDLTPIECLFYHLCRSNRSGGDEQHVVVDIVRPCSACQEFNMVLKQKPVMNS